MIDRLSMTLSWKEIIQKYIAKHANQIQKTTQPLKDHFGVQYFTYHRIDNEGRYTVLVDRPDWAEYYVSEKIYLNDPYLRNADIYQSGMCLINSHGSEDYKKKILEDGMKFGLDSAIVLIQKDSTGVDFFGFSGNQATSDLDKIYLNQPSLLSSFGFHFKNELNPVLKKMELEAGLLLDLKGKDFLVDEQIQPALNTKPQLDFLRSIRLLSKLKI